MATQTTTTSSKSTVDASTLDAVRKLFTEAKALYAPEGEFMAGTEAQLARGQKKSVASGAQGLAAAGLASTSLIGGLGKAYEEEVATPARAQASSARLSALTGLLQSEAGAEASLASRSQTQETISPLQPMYSPKQVYNASKTSQASTARSRADQQWAQATQPQQPQQPQQPRQPQTPRPMYGPVLNQESPFGTVTYNKPQTATSSFYSDFTKAGGRTVPQLNAGQKYLQNVYSGNIL